jgi:hypothetical protein
LTQAEPSRFQNHRRYLRHPLAEGGAAVAFALYVGWPLLRPDRVVIGFDTIAYTGPNTAVSASSWRHLRIPEWNDTIFGGVPHVANPHSGALYPLKFPFLFLDARRALGLITLMHLVLLAVGIVVLVRWRLRLRAPAGLVAAATVLGSGMLMARSVQFEQMVVVAWIPWVLIGIDWVLRSPRATRWSVPFLAAVVAVMVTGAHAQSLYNFGGLVAAWTLGRVLDARTFRRLWLVGAAGVLGVCLAAPELLPVAEFASRAAHSAQTLEAVGQPGYIIGAKRALATVLGDIFSPNQAFVSGGNENMTSIGVAASVFALIGAAVTILWRRAKRWTAVMLTLAGLISFLFALGPRTVVFRAAFRLVPGFDSARVPARWRDITVMCAALLAAYAVDYLRSGRVNRRAVEVSAAIVGFGVLATVSGRFDLPETRTLVAWAVVSVACVGAVVLGDRHWRVAAAALATLLVLVEMGVMVPGNFLRSSSQPVSVASTPGAADRFLQEHPDRMISFTQEKYDQPQYLLDGLRPNANSLIGVRSIDGYDGGLQITKEWSQTMPFLETAPPDDTLLIKAQLRIPLDPSAWARFGVRWALVDRDLLEPSAVVGGWNGPVLTDGPFEIYENPAFQGEAFLYRASRPLSGDQSSGEQLRALGTAASTTALTDPGVPSLECANSCGRTAVNVQRLYPGAMRTDVDVTQPSLLVTDEQWDKGWTATVDGHSAKVLRADGFSAAVALESGHHVVEWRYHTPGLRLGLVLAFLGLLVCVAVGFELPARLNRRYRSRPAAAEPPT